VFETNNKRIIIINNNKTGKNIYYKKFSICSLINVIWFLRSSFLTTIRTKTGLKPKKKNYLYVTVLFLGHKLKP